MKYNIKRIATLGLLIAMEVVLSRFLSIATPILKISLAFIPVVAAAILYGPVWAGSVAALGDLLGALLFPIGVYFPGFTVTAFISGMVYGLFLYNKRFKLINAIFPAAIVSLGLNMCLDTFWLYLMLKFAISEYNVFLYLPSRIIKGFVMVPVIALGIVALEKLLRRYTSKLFEEEKSMLRKRAKSYFVSRPERRQRISKEISERIVSLKEYKDAKTVFCFVGTEKEIDTAAIIDAALADKKTVCVPLCKKGGDMSAREIGSRDELSAGYYNILEPPKTSTEISPEKIDFAIVPASACDKRRGRIGQGGGYYDRYLDKTAIFKVAICPQSLVVEKLPLLESDVDMDLVITERGRI